LFVASTQLPKLFGFKGGHGSFWERMGGFFSHLGDTNGTALAMGGVALAVLVLGKVYMKHKPVTLAVVIAGIVAASLIDAGARASSCSAMCRRAFRRSGCRRCSGAI
jgi:MFS superfamily sulfate permease-like transporter